MQNIQHIKDKDAVLVPLKEWEKIQKELIRLRKRAEKDELLKDLREAVADIETDLKLPLTRRKKRQTADEFLREMQDGK